MMSISIRERLAEGISVLLNLLFTFYYLRSNPICFLFGIIAPILLAWPCMKQKLYGQVLLQGFYVAVAIYGFVNFGGEWRVEQKSLMYHVIWLSFGAVASLGLGKWLTKRTQNSWSYVDAAVTIFSMIGTWMMMNFIHENWLYLIGVNAVSVVLYSSRKLWIAAVMFLIYLLMSVDGYFDQITIFGT